MHIKGMLRLLKQCCGARDRTLTQDEEQKIAVYAELLPEPDRTIFVLWRYHSMPTEKIAKRLCIQRDAVRNSLTQSYANMLVTVFPQEPEALPLGNDIL